MSSIYSNIENADLKHQTKTEVGYDPALDPMVGVPPAPPRQKSSRGMKIAVFFAFLFSIFAIGVAAFLYFQLQSSWEKRDNLEQQIVELSKSSTALGVSTNKILDKVQGQVSELSANYETVQDDINNNRFEISTIQRTVFDLQDRSAAMAETINQIKNKVLFDPFSSTNTDVNPSDASILPTVISIDDTTTSSGPVWQTPDGSYTPSTNTESYDTNTVDSSLPSQRTADEVSSQQNTNYEPTAASSALSFGSTPTPTFTPAVATTASSAPVATTSTPVIATSGPRVMTVNKKFNFIVVNMGLKDGVKMGDRLEVRRGSESIGRVEVEKLYDDFSAATIANQKDNYEIQEGDQIVR
jgi:uncharacterized protein YoxC